ncbi:class I adenylate-forming enzyme family protein [Kitasatospora viridis]|uniref:Yersiniabactin salicyl-AMP ligase n=1 Tax=Kitasatospora viridis TaxID=281105 RepID=A0A561T652_9ACTN|nr:class I adenylate-forming enzyme family protein [Kitasatospora viridis]TWF82590.1 yersiniabactin salicyl-AMP ligase [Kitasatospora viridis]
MTARAERAGLYQAVRESAELRPEAIAVRTQGGAAVTYRELIALADRQSAGLRRHGVGPGDTVAVRLSSGIGYVALILAVARLGARYVPLLENFGPEDQAHVLARLTPRLLVTDGTRAEPAPAPAALPSVELAELTEPAAQAELADGPAGASELPPQNGVFRLLWTSGTTRFPKAAAWRQDRYVAERRRWCADLGIGPEDRFLCRHPLDVAHATDLHVMPALLSGASVLLADPRTSGEQLLALLRSTGTTVLSALPSHYEALLATRAAARGARLPDLRYPICGGAYVSPALAERCREVLGVRLVGAYGSTEFGVAMWSPPGRPLVPHTGVSARIVPFTPDHPDLGELVLRSADSGEGYPLDPQDHDRTFRDGEYWTGDMARRLGDGGLRVLGRVSEALATAKGPLLAPELDEELLALAGVAEVVCLPAVQGEYRAELLVAVHPVPGTAPDAAATAVRQALAAHELTGDVREFDELPRTPVGKVDKPRVRTWFDAR